MSSSSGDIVNVLAILFVAVSSVWMLLALIYAASVFTYFHMRSRGLLLEHSPSDPEYGRVYLFRRPREDAEFSMWYSYFYIPMGWMFRQIIQSSVRDQEQRERMSKAKVMTRQERRDAVQVLLSLGNQHSAEEHTQKKPRKSGKKDLPDPAMNVHDAERDDSSAMVIFADQESNTDDSSMNENLSVDSLSSSSAASATNTPKHENNLSDKKEDGTEESQLSISLSTVIAMFASQYPDTPDTSDSKNKEGENSRSSDSDSDTRSTKALCFGEKNVLDQKKKKRKSSPQRASDDELGRQEGNPVESDIENQRSPSGMKRSLPLHEDKQDKEISSSGERDSESCSSAESQVCPICLSSLFADGEGDDSSVRVATNVEIYASTKCSHMFHKECLLDWLSRPATVECPCCRVPFFDEDDVYKQVRANRQNQRRLKRQVKSRRSSTTDPQQVESSAERRTKRNTPGDDELSDMEGGDGGASRNDLESV